MSDSKKLRERIVMVKAMPNKTQWSDIRINDILHIPQIWSIKRKDVIVTSKDDNIVTYKEIGQPNSKTFAKNSFIAHLVTKKHTY